MLALSAPCPVMARDDLTDQQTRHPVCKRTTTINTCLFRQSFSHLAPCPAPQVFFPVLATGWPRAVFILSVSFLLSYLNYR